MTEHSPRATAKALNDLNTFIEDNGPFDGIMGFSHGGAVAASYILDRQIRYRHLPAPFSFAIFLSPTAPTFPDPSHLHSMIKGLLRDSPPTFLASFPHWDYKLLGPKERAFSEYLALYALFLEELGIKIPVLKLDFIQTPNTDDVPRLLHPALIEDRISIPTVHTTGEKEGGMFGQMASCVQGLCHESLRRTHRHRGGHSLPLKEHELWELASSVHWAAERGGDLTRQHRAGFKL